MSSNKEEITPEQYLKLEIWMSELVREQCPFNYISRRTGVSGRKLRRVLNDESVCITYQEYLSISKFYLLQDFDSNI